MSSKLLRSKTRESAKNLERQYTEKLRGERVIGITLLPRKLLGTYHVYLLPLMTSLSTMTGIIVSLV